ncbi:hypothetical protein GCM10010211_34320 [Streptomyces albospinus]|uniref:Uncharacterized protein n=1 Tax=Streptomyces albospinus TaxID=285515 RepID=A0ABQ2V3A5_9ACTN|nr:NRAMP family divalent metal transporter [Streptomyces albospinus]GGU66184.1 hypothetical protein GCM10010211_34320 [Streptomyces albospinus]
MTETTLTHPTAPTPRSAVLDDAHVGDIRGALGTIKQDDTGERRGLSAKFKTLLAIVGPGLIVMVGDNDAGAFATYGQAGQNYSPQLLWTLLLLIPVLYVNQEMVLRLGAVTGVGHARLILERFGKFWGAFSVIDPFLLNALTLVTEFIGITMAAGYLGLPKAASVILAAAIITASAFTGSFRRFERIAVALCAASLLLVPLYFMLHPKTSQMAHDFVVPVIPGGYGELATVMLLIIGIVGTTVAPWQLFFQQSYVIDKRITPRFMKYEKADLWIGIAIVVIGAAAMMGLVAAAFAGTKGFGNFTDTAGLITGIAAKAGKVAGVLFAIALLDALIIGAFAVSLSTAYAIGDVFGMKHSLHWGIKGAKGFYAVYAGLVTAAASIVLIPGPAHRRSRHHGSPHLTRAATPHGRCSSHTTESFTRPRSRLPLCRPRRSTEVTPACPSSPQSTSTAPPSTAPPPAVGAAVVPSSASSPRRYDASPTALSTARCCARSPARPPPRPRPRTGPLARTPTGAPSPAPTAAGTSKPTGT